MTTWQDEADILAAMIRRLNSRHAWLKEGDSSVLARNSMRRPVEDRDDYAVAWTLYGAFLWSAPREDFTREEPDEEGSILTLKAGTPSERLYLRFLEVMNAIGYGEDALDAYNDDPTTTHADIMVMCGFVRGMIWAEERDAVRVGA